MHKLILKPEAISDLEKIYEYTFWNWGIVQAEKYQDELFIGMQSLLNHIELGKKYPHSNLEYRKLHINRHLIFYREEHGNIVIVRLLHDRMDVSSWMK